MIDDQDLYAAWIGGDRAAGATLTERHFPAIERFFAHKTSTGADDLVQQTFLRAVQAPKEFRGDGSFRAFLFGIARNVLFEHIRKRVRAGREVPDFAISTLMDLVPGASTLLGRESDTRSLVLALQRIPLDLQLLLELYYWEELPLADLAEIFGVPSGTIKSRLFRARGLVRDAMEAVPGDEDDKRSARSLLQGWLADVRIQGADVPGRGSGD
jgi:RNA polymerase sigma-70 factor (ECF subfamily)